MKKFWFYLAILILLIFTCTSLNAHERLRGPLPEFYLNNIDNLELLSEYIGLSKQRSIIELHYYYYYNETAQEIIANLMDYPDDKTQIRCLGVVNHCCRANLSEDVRKQVFNSLKRMCKSSNYELRYKAAYCIGVNLFSEGIPILIGMIDDKIAIVRSHVFIALESLRTPLANDDAEKRLEIEENKVVINAIKNYLQAISRKQKGQISELENNW